MKRALAILGIVFYALCAPGFAQAGQRTVTASFLPIAIFAENVSTGLMRVNLLVPPGAEVHDFNLRPQDLRELESAELVFINGAGLEDALLRPYRHKERIIDTSRGIALLSSGRVVNPHIWLDPIRAISQVRNIQSALSALDPAQAGQYAKNADAYIARLRALDAEIRATLSRLPSRTLVTYHDFMGYFAERYGLEAYSLTGPQGEQPLPRRVAVLENMVKSKGVRAVFIEEGFPESALSSLKQDLGVRVCKLKSFESGHMEAEYYESAMTANMRSIKDCMGGR